MRLHACLLVLVGLVVLWLPAGALAAEGGCPNEALRVELHAGGLPDCRAYELVSPTFKDGGFPLEIKAISGDGSRVIAAAFGAFAGAEGFSSPVAELGGSIYEFSRTGSGWVTTALSPPASRFPGVRFLGASRDLSRTLWVVREASQPVQDSDLYRREADGRFVKMGVVGDQPGVPGGSSSLVVSPVFEGASADLSVVVASSYEYRVGAEPQLLGVSEGKSVSSCGSVLGNGDLYNAVSGSGSTVFLTASCGAGTNGELYAQLNDSEMVDLSEPSPVQCEECQTARSATPTAEMPAAFQGASEDGSKVFFTTEQELLKGHTTENLYEFDFDRGVGQRVLLASNGSPEAQVQGIARVSEDGSHVYFVARGVLAGNENRSGEKAVVGQENLYVYERDGAYPQGRVRFIAANTGIQVNGYQGYADIRQVQTTPDGRFLVFDDSSGVVFEYDSQEELLVKVSPKPASLFFQNYSNLYFATVGPDPALAQSTSNVSADGSVVIEDAEEHRLFEYRSAGSIAEGVLYPLTESQTVGSGWNAASGMIDASGGDVFLYSLKSLVPGDTDTGEDIYDVRVDGGFAEPPVAGCVGEACQGAPAAALSFIAPGSSAAMAGGNLSPPMQASPPAPAPRPRALTRAQKLAKALRACRRRPRRARSVCEAQARKRYGGGTSRAKQSDRRVK